MLSLRKVLAAKIGITMSAWAIPLLLFPLDLFVLLGFPPPQPEIFLRLLGTAYCALVVGYNKAKSTYPAQAVWVGIVSNGGATAVLTIAALVGTWSTWGSFAQTYMWFSWVSVALITAGLVLQGPCNKSAQ